MTAPPAKAPLTGGCLCGAIRFEIVGPTEPVTVCHCAMCRKFHGHTGAYTGLQRDQMTYVGDGRPAWYQSSENARRGFCAQCGSSLIWERVGARRISVAAGVLDGPTGLVQGKDIFVDDAGDYYPAPGVDESPIGRLRAVMARLRAPDGCPWDREQTFASIAPYTIEEAYEVVDAIERNDLDALRDELGDLLFQVIFHAQMAADIGAFDFDKVAETITAKMIDRHPHVFGAAHIPTADAQRVAWEDRKAAERAAKAEAGETTGALDGVPLALPALTRALKLQKRAARVGFDWSEALPILDKIEEEIAELRVEMLAGDTARATDELGDVLFAVANLARHLSIDPERALQGTSKRFERRFAAMEGLLATDGLTPGDVDLDRLEALWAEVKRIEKSTAGKNQPE